LESWLLENGYPALFVLSFMASTLVPLGSEWLLAVLLVNDFELSLVVPVATVGNTAGALTTYAIGLWGGPWLVRRVLRISQASQQRAERNFNRYGSWVLLFSWVPLLGDPLCLASGVLKTGFWRFVMLVAFGKFLRYLVVAKLVMQGVQSGLS
jgi:membrane protein YqaA with SNARE-associated domain